MRAVILVGGFGTRLRPLTLGVPKQMLPIGGVTMLERVVAGLARHGVTEAVLSLGYEPGRFLERFGDDRCAGVHLVYATEPEPLDTAGAIAFAARLAGIDETFIAVNGDVLTDADVTALVEAHRRSGAQATISLVPVDDPSRFGVVTTDPEGRVLGFVEKPPAGTAPSNWINAGTYVLEPGVLDLIPAGRPMSIERDVFPVLAERGQLHAVQSDAYWLDAGTHRAFLDAHLDLLSGRRGDPEVAVSPTATVDPSAEIVSSYIGDGAVVGADTVVTNSVVMAGARVGADAVIDDSIVASGACVGAGARLSAETVVGFDCEVPAGARLVNALIPDQDSWA